MPTPAVTLKLKKFRRRFGIAAPRVIVRSHLGWQWYAVGLTALAMLVGSIVWSIAQQGEASQLRQEIGNLQGQLADRDDELARLRTSAGTEQNVVQMERATQQRLLSRIKILELENAGLKEDISLFERLVPADGDESSVRIERLRVLPDLEAGSYRYRLLLGFQPSKQVREFKGRLQLAIVIAHAGREEELTIPTETQDASEYGVEVKHFLRKEGGFSIPLGAKLKSVEVRLLQGDVVKAKRLAQL